MKSINTQAVDDLFEALRSQQVFDIADVQLAIVETTGQISVYVKKEKSPLTLGDVKKTDSGGDPPLLIIDNGEPVSGALETIGCEPEWLDKVLKNEGCNIEDIFIMTADSEKNYNIIQKEE